MNHRLRPRQGDVIPYEEQTFGQRFLNWNVPNLDTKNEVRLGIPWLDALPFASAHRKEYLSGLQGDYISSTHQFGIANEYYPPQLSFMVRWNERWEYGLSCFYVQQRQNLYSTVTGQTLQEYRYDCWAISPTLRWNIVRWRWFRFYAQTGLAVALTNDLERGFSGGAEFFLGYGYTVGTKIFFFGETNFSEDLSCMAIGVGYRF